MGSKQQETQDSIVLAAKAEKAACIALLKRAIRVTTTFPGTLPLTAEECVQMLEAKEIGEPPGDVRQVAER